jgi:very-short-patch-repair endonuclease
MSHRNRSARSSVARTALLRSRARFMLRHPTDSEELLWQYLRGKRLLGVQFRRQVPLHGFIVDFYASSIKLVVEVDGGWHNGRAHLDAARDRKLRAKGVRVVRVSAGDISSRIAEVLVRISREI